MTLIIILRDRIKQDFWKAGPLLIFIPGMFFLPMLVPLLVKFPTIAPSTFHTIKLVEMQTDRICQNRQKLALPLSRVFFDKLKNSQSSSTVVKAYEQQLNGLESRINALQNKKKSSSNTKATPSLKSFSPLIASTPQNLTLASLSTSELSLVLRFLSKPFSRVMPLTRLYKWADWILKDDMLLHKDGVGSLSAYELVEALEERGYTGYSPNMQTKDLRKILDTHVSFSRDCIDKLRRKNGKESISQSLPGEHGLEPHEVLKVAFFIVAARAVDVKV